MSDAVLQTASATSIQSCLSARATDRLSKASKIRSVSSQTGRRSNSSSTSENKHPGIFFQCITHRSWERIIALP